MIDTAADDVICAVLFDLDGTLADTAPDMAGALNALRVEQRLEPLPFAALRPYVSHGAPALIRVGFGESVELDREVILRRRFLELYETVLCRETRLFPGLVEVLDVLEARGLHWGVVTNKPGWLAAPLLAALGLERRLHCLVSGDSLARRKPDPLPLLHAADELGVEPQRCVYLGDAERDIVAGRAAGMQTLIARWGYFTDEDRPEHWGADAIISAPPELLQWLAGFQDGARHAL